MGGVLRLAQGETASLTVETHGVENAEIEWVAGANAPALRLSSQELVQLDGSRRQTATLTGVGRSYWVRANIRNQEGELVLIGSPVYIEEK